MQILPLASLISAVLSIPLLDSLFPVYPKSDAHPSIDIPTKESTNFNSYVESLVKDSRNSRAVQLLETKPTTLHNSDPLPTHLALRHLQRDLEVRQDSLNSFLTVTATAAETATATATAATGTGTATHKHPHHKHHHHHGRKHPHHHHHCDSMMSSMTDMVTTATVTATVMAMR